jgi:hypothetical protein
MVWASVAEVWHIAGLLSCAAYTHDLQGGTSVRTLVLAFMVLAPVAGTAGDHARDSSRGRTRRGADSELQTQA